METPYMQHRRTCTAHANFFLGGGQCYQYVPTLVHLQAQGCFIMTCNYVQHTSHTCKHWLMKRCNVLTSLASFCAFKISNILWYVCEQIINIGVDIATDQQNADIQVQIYLTNLHENWEAWFGVGMLNICHNTCHFSIQDLELLPTNPVFLLLLFYFGIFSFMTLCPPPIVTPLRLQLFILLFWNYLLTITFSYCKISVFVLSGLALPFIVRLWLVGVSFNAQCQLG